MDRLRRFEVLVRVAEAGSFAKAARLLQLDPSALSRAITELERELRITLFYRTTRQLRLTEEGDKFYRRARDILLELADLESVATSRSERLTGTLRVGSNVPTSRHIIMPRLPDFLRKHPGLRVECLVLHNVTDMHAGGLDLLIRAGEPPESDLIARKLMEFRFGVYAAPQYLDSAGEPLTPDDLLRHRCLVHKPPAQTKPWDEWEFERNGERQVVKVPSVLMTDDREGLIAAALAGCGLMRIGMFDPALITSGRLRKVLNDWTCPNAHAHSLYAIYRKTARASPKISAFLEFVTEAFAAFDPDELTLIHRIRSGAA